MNLPRCQVENPVDHQVASPVVSLRHNRQVVLLENLLVSRQESRVAHQARFQRPCPLMLHPRTLQVNPQRNPQRLRRLQLANRRINPLVNRRVSRRVVQAANPAAIRPLPARVHLLCPRALPRIRIHPLLFLQRAAQLINHRTRKMFLCAYRLTYLWGLSRILYCTAHLLSLL